MTSVESSRGSGLIYVGAISSPLLRRKSRRALTVSSEGHVARFIGQTFIRHLNERRFTAAIHGILIFVTPSDLLGEQHLDGTELSRVIMGAGMGERERGGEGATRVTRIT